MSAYDIDFVVLWVDGSDENWLREKAKYTSVGDDSIQRYRDWDIFRYWFRGVEKFAPWVHRVHFITWGHLPSWLNTDHPKLNIVKHTDYIPQEYLPTFNSNVIEINIHRINGLSEHFVNFNDDVQIIKPIKPTDFFIDGKPVDMLALQPAIANPDNPEMSHILFNNAMWLAKYYKKYECMKRIPGKFFNLRYPFKYLAYNVIETAFPQFTAFYDPHSAMPLLLSTYRELWEKESELLDKVSRNRFRSITDINLYSFRTYEKLRGNFVPRNIHKQFCYIDVSQENAADIITRRNRKIVCINDSEKAFDFEQKKAQMQAALQKVLPEKSSFEK